LSADLRSLGSAKQDVEHKKKKVEGQLNDLNSRFNESERQRNELGERVSKMTVSYTEYICYIKLIQCFPSESEGFSSSRKG